MKLSQLTYVLPEKLIANEPASPRDSAKLLILNRLSGEISNKHFTDLTETLTDHDVLVFNETKVFPARVFGTKETGGKVEFLLLKEVTLNTWQAMHRGKILDGQKIIFPGATATIVRRHEAQVEIKFDVSNFWEWIDKHGVVPLPPYIHSKLKEQNLREEYQTVFAKVEGSVAAPTAGLHFTEELLQKLKNKGVQMEYITLHVGAGTFLPIKTDDITQHKMHAEHYVLTPETARSLNNAKAEGKRIIAVGTTTTRVLETCANETGELKSASGSTNIFIYPPYRFKYINALITNFHLPESTLLALVSAFVSSPNTASQFSSFKESIVGKAYQEAIENNYRFYSFGDGMMIG